MEWFLIVLILIFLGALMLCWHSDLRKKKAKLEITKYEQKKYTEQMFKMFDDKSAFLNDSKGLEERKKFFLERLKSDYKLRKSSDFHEVVIALARIELESIEDEIKKKQLFLKRENQSSHDD